MRIKLWEIVHENKLTALRITFVYWLLELLMIISYTTQFRVYRNYNRALFVTREVQVPREKIQHFLQIVLEIERTNTCMQKWVTKKTH